MSRCRPDGWIPQRCSSRLVSSETNLAIESWRFWRADQGNLENLRSLFSSYPDQGFDGIGAREWPKVELPCNPSAAITVQVRTLHQIRGTREWLPERNYSSLAKRQPIRSRPPYPHANSICFGELR